MSAVLTAAVTSVLLMHYLAGDLCLCAVSSFRCISPQHSAGNRLLRSYESKVFMLLLETYDIVMIMAINAMNGCSWHAIGPAF